MKKDCQNKQKIVIINKRWQKHARNKYRDLSNRGKDKQQLREYQNIVK